MTLTELRGLARTTPPDRPIAAYPLDPKEAIYWLTTMSDVVEALPADVEIYELGWNYVSIEECDFHRVFTDFECVEDEHTGRLFFFVCGIQVTCHIKGERGPMPTYRTLRMAPWESPDEDQEVSAQDGEG